MLKTSQGLSSVLSDSKPQQQEQASHPSSLTKKEEVLLSFLDTLPQCFIEKEVKKSTVVATNALVLFMVLFVVLTPPFLATWAHAVFGSAIALGVFLSTLICAVGLLGVVSPPIDKVFSYISRHQSINSEQKTKERQQLLEKAIMLSDNDLVRGRLSELYFLVDHPKVAVAFWTGLKKAIETFGEASPQKLDIQAIRQHYRHTKNLPFTPLQEKQS